MKLNSNKLIQRDPRIDLARTIAISMVILVHSTGIGFGRFGVQLFFVISGYLLANFNDNQSRVQFIVGRAFRLFPLVFVFVVFFYLKEFDNTTEAFFNLLLIQNLWGGFNTFPCGWSISCEWLYSILILFLIPYKKKSLLFLLGFSLALQLLSGAYVRLTGGINVDRFDPIFRSWINTTNPYINLGFFISGILIYQNKKILFSIRTYKLVICILVILLFEIFIGHFMAGWQFSIPAIFIMCNKFNINGIVFKKFIEFIGKRTYGIFFCHLYVFDSNLVFPNEFQTILNLPGIGLFINFVFNYILAVIGGFIAYKYVEKPGMSLGRRVTARLK